MEEQFGYAIFEGGGPGSAAAGRPAVSAVTVVEIEALLLRVAMGQTDHNDANMLRSILQGLVGTIRHLEGEIASGAVRPRNDMGSKDVEYGG